MLGTAVGPYEVVKRLGAGGMGEVFLGYDTRLQRKVALKHLNKIDEASAHTHSRVLREARAAARLNHPNIASIYDVIEEGQDAIIVMEYVDGDSLRTRLADGPLPLDDVIAIGSQLVDAVAAAHAQGVIHRDLKPSNIQLTHTGAVKVLDFGVAKVVTPVEQTSTTTREPSRSEGIRGTPIYMAPEQLMGGECDVRSDVYSLGVVLFEMATGRRPYAEADAFALAVAMSTMPAPAAAAVDPRVPSTLSAVITRALEREPLNRYQSAAELAGALASLSDPSPGAAATGRLGRLGRPARRWLVRATTGAAIVIGIVGVVRLQRESSLQPAVMTGLPAVIAILPVDNRAGDVRGDYIGAGLASVVATNFGSVSGITVLPTTVTGVLRDRPADVTRARRELGVTHIVALAVRAVTPITIVDVTLHRSTSPADVWSRTIRGDPLTIERVILDQLGQALTSDGVFPRTLSPNEWSRIRKLPTSSSDALQAYSEGRALLDRYDVGGNVEHAIQRFNRATELDPQFATAFAALGEALWTQYTGDKRPEIAAAATTAVMKALTLDGDLAPVHYALGLMQSQTGHYEEATASLRRALTLQPDSDETHRLLGRVLATLGDRTAALAELNRAIALRPFWNNYYSLGYVLYTNGDYNAALEALKKTTELRPTFAGAYQMLGTTYHMLGNLSQAIGYYEHAIRLGANPAAYANLGLAYYTAKQYEQARQAYLEAIAHQPRRATLYKSLGDVYGRLGRTDESNKLYEYAMRIARDDLHVNPRDAYAIVLLGNCEAKLARHAEAERHAAEATMLAPADRDIWIRTAKLYVAVGRRALAVDAVRMAVELGYEPGMVLADDELQPIGPLLKRAVDAGLTARAKKGAMK